MTTRHRPTTRPAEELRRGDRITYQLPPAVAYLANGVTRTITDELHAVVLGVHPVAGTGRVRVTYCHATEHERFAVDGGQHWATHTLTTGAKVDVLVTSHGRVIER